SRESTTYPRFGNWKGGTLPLPFTKYNVTASHEEEPLPPYKTHLPEVGIRGGPLSPSCTCSTIPNLTWQSQLLQENRSQTWLCAPRGHLIICGHPKGRLRGPIYRATGLLLAGIGAAIGLVVPQGGFAYHKATLCFKGGVCTIISKTCCTYIDATGQMEEDIQKVYKQAQWLYIFGKGNPSAKSTGTAVRGVLHTPGSYPYLDL
ncbi:hypothetical protein EI555_009833, partial [Monodon monoceros]